ncbi:MAG: hypothetical protein LAN71_17805 [Acidobacteriia bacterium]|nr:hypothetical protein [Terriglobia bacterium]
MSYDGIAYGNRVDNFNERKLHGKVVDNLLNAPTMYSRVLSKGQPFVGKTMDWAVDVVSDTQGEFFVGLETLNSSAVSSTIPLSFAHTAFTQPKVGIMLESFANIGETATIDLDVFKYEKAAAEALQKLGTAVYADGTANRPNGLGLIVDDSGTIGGQARSTYSQLNATDTASGGTFTLAKYATLDDATRAASLMGTTTNIAVTTKTVFSLIEQLLTPAVRNEYSSIGFPKMGVRAMTVTRGDQAQAGNMFLTMNLRGKPIVADDFCTTGYLYLLNEDSFGWFGRSLVSDEWKPFVEKVDLGTMKAYEGVGAESLDLPSEYNGWFYQKPMVLPNQAGTISRFYVVGQMCTWEPRRNGRLTGITGV